MPAAAKKPKKLTWRKNTPDEERESRRLLARFRRKAIESLEENIVLFGNRIKHAGTTFGEQAAIMAAEDMAEALAALLDEDD